MHCNLATPDALPSPANAGSPRLWHALPRRFCFPCIVRWAEIENRCPFCKARFRSVRRKLLEPASPAAAGSSPRWSAVRELPGTVVEVLLVSNFLELAKRFTCDRSVCTSATKQASMHGHVLVRASPHDGFAAVRFVPN